MHDANDAMSAITKYQIFLATGEGNPKNDDARIELMRSNLKLVQKLKTEFEVHMDELEKLIRKSN